MNAKHTPGPWVANAKLGTISAAKVEKDGIVRPYATMAGLLGSMNAEQVANARLIAAAPDLLAALEDCERIITFALNNHQLDGQNRFDADHSISGIRAAIAKAKGE